MKTKDTLFLASVSFGVGAALLWIARLFTDISIIYPVMFNLLQYIFLVLMNKKKK